MFITTGGGDQQLKQVERERNRDRDRDRVRDRDRDRVRDRERQRKTERNRERERDLWDVPQQVVMSSSNRLGFAATMHTRMLTYADVC